MKMRFYTLLMSALFMVGIVSSGFAQSPKISDMRKVNQDLKKQRLVEVQKLSVADRSQKIKEVSRLPQKKVSKYVLEENDVKIKKIHQPTDKIISKRTNPHIKFKATHASVTLNETFESWDGEDFDWLPSGWTTKVTNTTEGSWGIATVNPFLPTISPASTAYVTCPFDMFNESDEWLITPQMTVKKNDCLLADLIYEPIWMYHFDFVDDEIVIYTDQIKATIQIMISTDNGSNWEELFDVAADIDYGTELDNYFIPGIRSFIDLKDYEGQNIKLAFRYVGLDGNVVAVDDVYVGTVSPISMYLRPDGTYYAGIYADDLSMIPGFFAPAYTDLTFWNVSTYAEVNEWEQYDITENLYESGTDPHFTVNFSPFYYFTPELTASLKDESDFYYYADDRGNGLVLSSQYSPAMNLDFNNGIASYAFDEENYCFGTCVGGDFVTDGIANYFEKPAQPALFEGITIYAGTATAPANTVFTLKLHRVVDNVVMDVLSTLTLKAEDIYYNDDGGLYQLVFIPEEPLVIDDAILYELTGFNTPGVEFGAISSRYSDPYESNAYVFLNVEREEGIVRELWSSYEFLEGDNLSLLFVPELWFCVLHPDKGLIDCDPAGGTAEIKVETTFNPDMEEFMSAEMDQSWARITNKSIASGELTFITTYTIQYDALPSGTTKRKANLVLKQLGSYDVNVPLAQGDFTSIENPNALTAKVIKNGAGSFTVEHDLQFKNLEIFNTAGQLVTAQQLSDKGTTSVSVSGLPAGVYLFKLKGDNVNKTIKVIK